MACLLLLTFGLLLAGPLQAQPAAPEAAGKVVLLHGLARSSGSMGKMERALAEAGFAVCNVGYPSRHHPIDTLALAHVLPTLRTCFPDTADTLHFVTHSLGGILVRQLAAAEAPIRIGRVVMLGPPNQGSEVVDKLGGWWAFKRLNGPAGAQLGTDSLSVPNTLGPAPFEVGVIAGTRSINWILSLLIPGPDDGKVSTERARLAGMTDYLLLKGSHPYLMKKKRAISQTLHFLAHGHFLHEEEAERSP